MKPQRAFVAERAAAQHCPELLRRGPSPAELLVQFERAGTRLARLLPDALAPLLDSARCLVEPGPARELALADLAAGSPPLAAHSLFALGGTDLPVLLRCDGGAVLRMVDRAFGGEGELPARMPDTFSPSAQLLIERLESALVQALGAAFGGKALAGLRHLRRGSDLTRLEPFAADCRLAAVDLELRESERTPWRITLALPLEALPALLGSERRSAGPRTADPAAAPFAELPLPLSAVLVDMQVPLAAISQIEPGKVLPVAVARAVPLRIGSSLIARGTVGAQDDRIAIKLTQIA